VTVALSAFLSPPDPISLMLIALPVIILMEGTLIIDSMFSVSRSVR
jgi:Sec-independent protein secretion pathway component TatC